MTVRILMSCVHSFVVGEGERRFLRPTGWTRLDRECSSLANRAAAHAGSEAVMKEPSFAYAAPTRHAQASCGRDVVDRV